ncbi:phosphate ABC transporter substrate-binding protein PstS [Inquilinus sp.]|uniref:phosphate ABC transporter substrate-binding protein PstS n=1 Tax=Inquilinus sp. TaxID=1932117 RepID=UPI003783EF7A
MKLFSRSILRSAVLGAAVALVAGASQAADISGAGATFPYPVYAKWADAYKKESGIGLNYQSIGSGGGIKQIKEKTVTFGASDMPLKPEDLDAAGLVQFPMIMGGVVPVVNIPGVAPGQLILSGDLIAQIYLGDITAWNDDKIKALNPGVTLPDTAIAPAYRSDGSGTNFLFTTYLSSVNAKFKDNVGANSSVQWPAGIGAKGNEGVANTAKQTVGAIGYVEYAYAKQNKLTYVKLVNKDGKAVDPTIKTFQAAASAADWANAKGYYVILTNEPGAESWPITGASFILMYKQPQDPAASATALQFFSWAYAAGGDKLAEDLDYVPMPNAVVDMVHKTWADNIKGADGKPIWTASK